MGGSLPEWLPRYNLIFKMKMQIRGQFRTGAGLGQAQLKNGWDNVLTTSLPATCYVGLIGDGYQYNTGGCVQPEHADQFEYLNTK